MPSHAQCLCSVLLLATFFTCILIAMNGLHEEVTVIRIYYSDDKVKQDVGDAVVEGSGVSVRTEPIDPSNVDEYQN